MTLSLFPNLSFQERETERGEGAGVSQTFLSEHVHSPQPPVHLSSSVTAKFCLAFSTMLLSSLPSSSYLGGTRRYLQDSPSLRLFSDLASSCSQRISFLPFHQIFQVCSFSSSLLPMSGKTLELSGGEDVALEGRCLLSH